MFSSDQDTCHGSIYTSVSLFYDIMTSLCFICIGNYTSLGKVCNLTIKWSGQKHMVQTMLRNGKDLKGKNFHQESLWALLFTAENGIPWIWHSIKIMKQNGRYYFWCLNVCCRCQFNKQISVEKINTPWLETSWPVQRDMGRRTVGLLSKATHQKAVTLYWLETFHIIWSKDSPWLLTLVPF